MELGFVGLGRMGSRMAARLLAAGHSLTVHDPAAAAVEEARGRGAAVAGSAREVADRADTVFTSLPTPEVVREVVLGPSGLAGGAQIRRLVDLSTTGSATTVELAAALAPAVAVVDAPVSGGTGGAEKGTLTLMAAGADGELAAVRPLLEELGRVFHVGTEPGLGQTMKLLNNYLAGAALATTAEAMAVGAKAGLDARTMIDVLNAASGRNTATADKFPRAVLTGTFDYGFAAGLMCKDVGLFAAEAAALTVPVPVGGVVHEMWRHTRDELGADADFTAIARLVEGRAGVEIRERPAR